MPLAAQGTQLPPLDFKDPVQAIVVLRKFHSQRMVGTRAKKCRAQ